jgi:hypothetical protein
MPTSHRQTPQRPALELKSELVYSGFEAGD